MPRYFAVLMIALLLGASHGRAAAHGGLSLDKDVCKLQLGRYSMHFTGYQPEATGSTEFCEDIPEVGQVVIVLDAVDAELRALPIEVRIIRDTGDQRDIEAVTVLHRTLQRYPTGTVSFEHKFDKPGKFVGVVTAGEKGEYVSSFPFSVASNRPGYYYYLFLLAVPTLGFALYLYAGRARRAARRPPSGPREAEQ